MPVGLLRRSSPCDRGGLAPTAPTKNSTPGGAGADKRLMRVCAWVGSQGEECRWLTMWGWVGETGCPSQPRDSG
eukprot:scaffold27070_cov84-Isochrysis_galbana.AAC.1